MRHPTLAGAFLPFNTYLQKESTLPERIRELVIPAYRVPPRLRVLSGAITARWRCVRGLTEGDIEAAQSGFSRRSIRPGRARRHRRAARRLTDPAPTWERLGQRLDDRQRMDLMFTFGGYRHAGLRPRTPSTCQLEDGAGTDEYYASVGRLDRAACAPSRRADSGMGS